MKLSNMYLASLALLLPFVSRACDKSTDDGSSKSHGALRGSSLTEMISGPTQAAPLVIREQLDDSNERNLQSTITPPCRHRRRCRPIHAEPTNGCDPSLPCTEPVPTATCRISTAQIVVPSNYYTQIADNDQLHTFGSAVEKCITNGQYTYNRVPDSKITWVDSLGRPIGQGSSTYLPMWNLGLGFHYLWMEAVDSDGYATYSTNHILVEVVGPDTTPTTTTQSSPCSSLPQITRPSQNNKEIPVTKNFRVQVDVPQFCDGVQIPESSIYWYYERGAALDETGVPATGRQTRLNMSMMQQGNHQIWVQASDTAGRVYTSSAMTIQVVGGNGPGPVTGTPPQPTSGTSATPSGVAPTVTISKPQNGKIVTYDQDFRAVVSAFDNVDGNIQDDRVFWYSDTPTGNKKYLTNGNGLQHLNAWEIGVGNHFLWVEATNSRGVTGTSEYIQIRVDPSTTGNARAAPRHHHDTNDVFAAGGGT